MKIDGTSLPPVGSVQASNRLGQVEKKALVSKADNVAVSDKAHVYQALILKVKEISSLREERVRTLTEQIERGDFKVDGQKIAEKMFSEYQKD